MRAESSTRHVVITSIKFPGNIPVLIINRNVKDNLIFILITVVLIPKTSNCKLTFSLGDLASVETYEFVSVESLFLIVLCITCFCFFFWFSWLRFLSLVVVLIAPVMPKHLCRPDGFMEFNTLVTAGR